MRLSLRFASAATTAASVASRSTNELQPRRRSGHLVPCILAVALAGPSTPAQQATPAPAVVKPLADGILQLDAGTAVIHGQTARFMVLEGVGNICYWTDGAEWLSWQVVLDRSGEYVVEMRYSCHAGSEGSTFEVALDGQTLLGTIAVHTGTWLDHEIARIGTLRVGRAGPLALSLKPTRKPGQAVMNLVWLRLIPARDYDAYRSRTAAERRQKSPPLPARAFVVPNFHPASCGWLTNWSTERNYCANSYLDHLDRVRDDANYCFALSECNNMIAIRNFQPRRFAELKERIAQGRVELVNAFFLEPTINLSGGEALARMGIEGLRWQQQVMGARPRFCWAIDVCGTHYQMAQLCAQLGLEALIYTRRNRTDKSIFWSESPDGSRILTLVPGHYSDDIGGCYAAREPLNPAQLRSMAGAIASKVGYTPPGLPVLILGGYGDYALAPARPENPTELLKEWKNYRPDCDLRFSTLSSYVDAVLPDIKSGKLELPTVRVSTNFTFDSFWIQNPRVKSWYRRDEHALQAAETLATIASLKSDFVYPAQQLYHAWLLMLLNMDRNTLWGAAGGMVFEHQTSWDARDRFEWVERTSAATLDAAARKLAGQDANVTLFNPANWHRTDPLCLKLPPGTRLADGLCQATGNGMTLCRLDVPPTGLLGVETRTGAAPAPKTIALPPVVETNFYTAQLDASTGALTSLKLKPSGRQMLGGPANVLVAEKHVGDSDPGDFTEARPKRPRLATSSDSRSTVTVTEGPLAMTVEAQGEFYGGGTGRRITRFFKNHPRIEFETQLNDIPNRTVVVAEFPLAETPAEIRRGIPFGFSRDDGQVQGITPAVRWSDYASPGKGGVAILDRGLTGREINDRTPVLYLLNATEKYNGYPNAWLSGKGSHRFGYALVAHDTDWPAARIPQLAWEYNCPVILADRCRPVATASFVHTSDNLIVEVMRRDGQDIEIRLLETIGQAGIAEVTVDLPHTNAALTSLVGDHPHSLDGGPTYKFPVRPQQIITLRLRTATALQPVKPLLEWDELVPPAKLPALREHLKNVKGHPPRGS
ncbi:MAG TPA: glycoside hydrolase family 38 C-terminal domain-containing protein [Phycisphaerae bacterium]|nr:glycoside hydrolase family 38 C-terminal domain-containing protein [Phycisphaerae bacterium]